MKKRKFNIKKTLSVIIILISFTTLIICGFKILGWKKDNNKIEEQINEIKEITSVTEVEDNENTEVIEQEEKAKLPSYYYDFIKMNLISVDFNELKNTNNDTVGWIQVNGSNVNYPFVQTTNNEYYLSHAYDKSGNYAGWIFLDYRNNINTLDKNTIIYGHGRLDRTMFGSLRDILTNGWLNDTSNFVIKMSTEKENTLWQVFSVYRIPTTSDYLRVAFSSESDFTNFTNMLINRSAYNFETTVSANDKILTLSTCHGQVDKVVIHAKLIKKETRKTITN